MTEVEKRKPLTRREALHLMIEQEGRCGCGCGQKLQPLTEGVIDEHVRALGLVGGNELTNRSLWRKPCAKAKTKGDHAAIAKAKRQAGETGQQARRDARGHGSIPQRANPWPPAGSRKLQSAPFPRDNRKARDAST